VTADELPPGIKGLQLEARLNGEVVQSASTGEMIFDVASLVSIIREAITFEAGDVIVSGTPSGIGWARTPKLLMKVGDVCEVSVEKIGTLRNGSRTKTPSEICCIPTPAANAVGGHIVGDNNEHFYGST
jgi:acylpyruvate hydrolase